MQLSKVCTFVGALVAGIAMSSTAALAVTNPGFESGTLEDWQATGQVGTFGTFKGVVDPTQGFQQVGLFTDRFTVQRRNAAASSVRLSVDLGTDISSALGGRIVRNGSAIQQSVNVLQPTRVNFDWTLAHRNDAPSGNDVAFVMVNGQATILSDLDSVAFTRFGEDNYIASETIGGEFLLDPGLSQIVFGVAAIDSPGGRTVLLLDNIQLTTLIVPDDDETDGGGVFPPPGFGIANPEPATAALVALAIGSVGIATQRRRMR